MGNICTKANSILGILRHNLATCPQKPGRVAQSVVRLTQKSEVSGSIPGPATYSRTSMALTPLEP